MNTTSFFNELPQQVMPVITVPNDDAVKPMIDAIVAGGCKVLEITLRTPAGLKAIAYAREAYPECAVGAGSVLNPDHYKAAVDAGAQFLISPGATDSLYAAHKANPVPWLPGVANASDLMKAVENGLDQVKFFPAMTLGGLPAIKNYAGVFPHVSFCPTGGVKPEAASEWLAEKMIFAVGGSWFTPADLVNAGDWKGLEAHIAKFWASFK